MITWAPITFTSFNGSSDTLTPDSGYHIEKVRQVMQSGTKYVQVEFTASRAQTSGLNARSGRIIFDPNRYWVMKEYHIEAAWGNGENATMGSIATQFEYDSANGPFPILKSVKQIVRAPSKQFQSENNTSCEFSLGTAAEEDLTLTAFGLPEPFDVQQARARPRWYLWTAITGGVCLVVAGLVRRWKRRVAC